MKLNSLRLPVNTRFESSGEFIEYLDKFIRTKKLRSSLKVIFTVSNFKTTDEFLLDLKRAGFKILSDYGCVFYLSKNSKIYGDIKYLALFTEKSNPIFFTLATKTKEIPPTLLEYLNKSRDISNLWISLTKMDEIVKYLEDEYSNNIIGTYFTGMYNSFFKRKSLIRPNIDRFIEYRGDDAIQAYNELKKQYGILPRVFEFSLLGIGTYRLDYRGILVIKTGSSFNFIYDIMKEIIKEVEKSKQIINKARIFDKPMKLKDREFKINVKIPWSAKLTKPVETVKFEDFVKLLESEWKFLPVDIDMRKNVENAELLDFSYFRIIDLMKPSEFSVIYRNENLRVYPSKSVDLGSSLRFFQSIKTSLDPEAILT